MNKAADAAYTDGLIPAIDTVLSCIEGYPVVSRASKREAGTILRTLAT